VLTELCCAPKFQGSLPPQILAPDKRIGALCCAMLRPVHTSVAKMRMKELVATPDVSGFKNEREFGWDEFLIFLSIHVIIRFHPNVKHRSLADISPLYSDKHGLAPLFFEVLCGKNMGRHHYSKFYNWFIRPLQATDDDEDPRVHLGPIFKTFSHFTRAMLRTVSLAQKVASDERLHPHNDRKAPYTRSKGKGVYGYWICASGICLRQSGLPVIMMAYPLLNAGGKSVTPTDCLSRQIELATEIQPDARPVYFYDSAYSTRDFQTFMLSKGHKYVTNLGTGDSAWGEYLYNITKVEGHLADPRTGGVYTYASDIRLDVKETRKASKDKGTKQRLKDTTHLVIELAKTPTDKHAKLFASNAVTVRRKAPNETAARDKRVQERVQTYTLRHEYANGFSYVDLFNKRLFLYSYKKEYMRHGSHWSATLLDYLLGTALLNSIHLYIEAEALEGRDAGEQMHLDKLDGFNMNELEDMSSEGDMMSSTDSESEEVPADSAPYGDSNQMARCALLLATQLAEISAKTAYCQRVGDKFVPKNSKKDAGEWTPKNISRKSVGYESTPNSVSSMSIGRRQRSLPLSEITGKTLDYQVSSESSSICSVDEANDSKNNSSHSPSEESVHSPVKKKSRAYVEISEEGDVEIDVECGGKVERDELVLANLEALDMEFKDGPNRKKNPYLKTIGGNGECLWRAISDQMCDNKEKWRFYKTKTLDWMRGNRLTFVGNEPLVFHARAEFMDCLQDTNDTRDWEKIPGTKGDKQLTERGWRLYLTALKKPATYGDGCCVLAAAYVLDCAIRVVYDALYNTTGLPLEQYIKPRRRPKKVLTLFCFGNTHFESIWRCRR